MPKRLPETREMARGSVVMTNMLFALQEIWLLTILEISLKISARNHSKQSSQSIVRDGGKNKHCPILWKRSLLWLEEDGWPGHPRPHPHRHLHPPPPPRLAQLQDRLTFFNKLLTWLLHLLCRPDRNEGRPASEVRSQSDSPKIYHCHC